MTYLTGCCIIRDMMSVRKIAVFLLAASFLLEATIPCCPDYNKYDTEIYSVAQNIDSTFILLIPPARSTQLNQNHGVSNICTAQFGMHCLPEQSHRHQRLAEINVCAVTTSSSLFLQGCLLQI